MSSFGKKIARLFGRDLSNRKVVLDGPADPEILQVREMLNCRRSDEAFAKLNQIKANGKAVRYADYLRACFFLQRGRVLDAIEALKEELRWFPDNRNAADLLKRATPEAPYNPVADDDFGRLLSVVRPYTMVGEARLRSLFALAREVCAVNLPGNFVECGVAGGGSSALLASVIAGHPEQKRLLFSFDTFTGMPASSELDTHEGQQADGSGWGTGTCAAPESSLLEICQKLGAREVVRPVKGLFADTLPAHRKEIGPIAMLHMDGDWYSSTRDVLENLYDSVTPGGRIQVDDYGHWDGCRRAVTEFMQRRGVDLKINRIDESGIWFVK